MTTAQTRAWWADPKVLLQLGALIFGLGVISAQVRANSESIRATASVVAQIQDRQAALETWRAGHEVSDQNEPVRIRDGTRSVLREEGIIKNGGK